MHRLFDPSTTRRRRILDGPWDFLTDPEDDGRDAGYYETFPDETDRFDVPAAWNVDPDYYEYEGPAWYRRRFELPQSGTTRIAFEGVCHDATVWLDGEHVADHYCGHTPFEVVADLAAGEHELVVRADNTRDERSIPKPGADWRPYGGITREVVVESVPAAFVDDVAVDYELDGDRADATVTVAIRNEGESRETDVSVAIGDRTNTRAHTVDPGRTEVEFEFDLSVDRWSPADPTLYDVVAEVGEGDRRDERREKVGFRSVAVTDTAILVNGEPVEIMGVNRHEDHPEWGHAQPLRLQELDLGLIEDAGMNAIRTAHYPNHPRFLDLCDRRGILVLEEIPLWQFDTERFERESVLDRAKTMLAEMIERDRTHPSVLAWSLTNECENQEQGVADVTAELAALARERDDRPVTLASNRYHPNGQKRWGDDRCLPHVDFICANAYPGWYEPGDYANVVATIREDFPEKPIVFTEFGAGAVYGEHTREAQKWSEEYQASFLVDAIETFRETDYVAGFTIWQFCDTRTDSRNFLKRPKVKNNKGIVDEYRRPKEGYHRVVDLLTD
jgi:beta-glucuronidase